METWPIETSKPEPYIDDSEYERFEGELSRRPVPGLNHAGFQRRMTDLLRLYEGPARGKVLQEWSISDGSGNWLTPDVTFSYPEFKTTRRGHLLVPAYLVVEIRSTDQSLKELFDKRERYRKWRIPHYWIVDPVENACYECSAVIEPRQDTLRAGEIEIAIRDIFGE
ncbi:MAG: Uma2 family endonuclease [Candidatus Acidiferrales bacterium]